MKPRCTTLARTAVVAVLLWAAEATAEVIVIANRTPGQVDFAVTPPSGDGQSHTIQPGDVLPLAAAGPLRIAYLSGGDRRQFLLDPNRAYYFGRDRRGRLGLQKIGLGGNVLTIEGTGVTASRPNLPVATVPVKILVDEDQRAVPKYWKRQLRKRVADASAILEKHCRVRFEVVAVDTWQSDDKINEFPLAILDFERKVRPQPARLAIGFTSQYDGFKPKKRLGGIRGPFFQHILIRERSNRLTEPERLEILVHELGHYLGATHSPEADSVMRPVLGDRKARQTGFRIGFDPVNTLVLNLVSEEVRARGVSRFVDFTPATQLRLHQIYTEMTKALPGDPVSKRYVTLVSKSRALETRFIVRHITRVARTNARRPLAADAKVGQPVRLAGDELAEFYIREAALAAKQLPGENAAAAFVLALGIALDDSPLWVPNPKTKKLRAAVETAEERARRLEVLGEPTMRGRRDLLQHFVVSAHLTVSLGSRMAEVAGLTKEYVDMSRRKNFSFMDMAANRAGIMFAEGMQQGKWTLVNVADHFTVERYLPTLEGLPEGLDRDAFFERFGTIHHVRYQKMMDSIRQRVTRLPPYDNSAEAAAEDGS